MSDLQPLPQPRLGRYRHYKGGEYELIGVTRHSETLEPLALYRPLYNDSGLWVRPYEMFFEDIEHEGRPQPRFAFVGSEPTFASLDSAREYFTPERCHILESWNNPSDSAASIARARVEPGVATQPHRLRGVVERYLIIEGEGVATVGGIEKAVGPGDVVVIPAGVSQSIANAGAADLVFYCICTPRFTPECYEAL